MAIPTPAQTGPKQRRKLHIKTYGCQMNVYDSARMADVLAPLGFETCAQADDADMVILNTCHIREKAAEKTFSDLGRLREARDLRRARGADMVIAVAGCVAQAEGAEINRRAPFVDIVVGPQAYHRLPEMVARAARAGAGTGRTGAGLLDTEFPAQPKFDFLPAPGAPRGGSAFVSIQEGCDKFCSFCVVPYTRGAEYSRPAAAILAEARALVEAGVCEITVLGQNVNAYHGKGPDGAAWNLARLLHGLAEIGGLKRLRYTTSHPRDMDEDLMQAHAAIPALMPFLHLPVQSGSDRILAAMNRGHRIEDYRRQIARLRRLRPDIAVSSDFIVGFPGEREADFAASLALIEEIGFAQAFCFKYSARPGTPAAMLDDQIPEALKAERLARLQETLARHQAAFNRTKIGLDMEVLFDRPGRKPGQWLGKSAYLQSVVVAAPHSMLGTLARVRIEAAYANSLHGTLLAQQGVAA